MNKLLLSLAALAVSAAASAQNVYSTDFEGADVPFHVGFHTTSPADQWRFYMCEFSVKQVDKVVDLQVDNVLSPVSGDNLSNAETVKVHVVNNGLDASDKFEVAYQLDGGAVVKEKVDRSLAPGEAMEYTFSQKADLYAAPQVCTEGIYH